MKAKKPVKRKELTFAEFCELPFIYTLGMRFDWGAHRQYCNEEHGLIVEVVTKQAVFGDIYSGWEPGKRTYYLTDDPREFETIDQLYVAHMESACGIKEKQNAS